MAPLRDRVLVAVVGRAARCALPVLALTARALAWLVEPDGPRAGPCGEPAQAPSQQNRRFVGGRDRIVM